MIVKTKSARKIPRNQLRSMFFLSSFVITGVSGPGGRSSTSSSFSGGLLGSGISYPRRPCACVLRVVFIRSLLQVRGVRVGRVLPLVHMPVLVGEPGDLEGAAGEAEFVGARLPCG